MKHLNLFKHYFSDNTSAQCTYHVVWNDFKKAERKKKVFIFVSDLMTIRVLNTSLPHPNLSFFFLLRLSVLSRYSKWTKKRWKKENIFVLKLHGLSEWNFYFFLWKYIFDGKISAYFSPNDNINRAVPAIGSFFLWRCYHCFPLPFHRLDYLQLLLIFSSSTTVAVSFFLAFIDFNRKRMLRYVCGIEARSFPLGWLSHLTRYKFF